MSGNFGQCDSCNTWGVVCVNIGLVDVFICLNCFQIGETTAAEPLLSEGEAKETHPAVGDLLVRLHTSEAQRRIAGRRGTSGGGGAETGDAAEDADRRGVPERRPEGPEG